MSCGSPMPRGERIAKPAEWGTHTAGVCFFDSGLGKEDCMATHRALSVQRSRVPRHAATAAALALVLLPTGRIAVTQTPPPVSLAPPVAPVRAVTDDYYGTTVVDPYRYMEDLQNEIGRAHV